jgi:hypothetical protein
MTAAPDPATARSDERKKKKQEKKKKKRREKWTKTRQSSNPPMKPHHHHHLDLFVEKAHHIHPYSCMPFGISTSMVPLQGRLLRESHPSHQLGPPKQRSTQQSVEQSWIRRRKRRSKKKTIRRIEMET